jgi:ATP/maltotriose-dependent transcriptional regulator MalT
LSPSDLNGGVSLQLAGLGIEHDDPTKLAASLSGQHPHIASCLVDEVLNRLSPNSRSVSSIVHYSNDSS